MNPPVPLINIFFLCSIIFSSLNNLSRRGGEFRCVAKCSSDVSSDFDYFRNIIPQSTTVIDLFGRSEIRS